jgi:hypothetical protein
MSRRREIIWRPNAESLVRQSRRRRRPVVAVNHPQHGRPQRGHLRNSSDPQNDRRERHGDQHGPKNHARGLPSGRASCLWRHVFMAAALTLALPERGEHDSRSLARLKKSDGRQKKRQR